MDGSYYDKKLHKRLDTSISAKLLRIAQSSLLFSAAFILVSYFNQIWTAIAARIIGFEPIFNYYGVSNLPTVPNLWTSWGILFVYGLGSFFCIVLAFIAYRLFLRLGKDATLLKVGILWVMMVAINTPLSFSLVSIVGLENYTTLFYRWFAVIAAWFFVPKVFVGIGSFFTLLLMFFIGFQTADFFLMLSFSQRLANNARGRVLLLFQLYLLPILLGSGITFAITQRFDWEFSLIKMGGLLVIFIGMLFKLQTTFNVNIMMKYDIFKKPSWVGGLYFILVVVFFNLVCKSLIEL